MTSDQLYPTFFEESESWKIDLENFLCRSLRPPESKTSNRDDEKELKEIHV